MDKRQREGFVRLFIGLTLNVGLWFVYYGLTGWSSIEREFRLNLIGSCLAAPALTFVMPVFWRGAPWQAPIAFLLVILPGFIIFSVFQFVQIYW